MTSSPLRWLGAIAIMAIVVVIAMAMLINTLGRTVQLSGDTQDPEAEFADASPEPTEAPEDDDDGGGEDDDADDEFPQTYTVEEGDTGAVISERFYGDPDGWQAIAEANDIDPSAPLRVGDELEIPPPPE